MRIFLTMNTCRSITIYNPNLKEGGTSLLYARLAKFLIENSSYEVTIVDYKEGVTAKYLNNRQLPFKLIEFSPEKVLRIESPTMFMVNLLTSKLLGDTIFLHPDSILHFVSTFPYDGFKYIPSSTLVYKWSSISKKYWALLLHPFHKKRIKIFLETAVRKNGLAFMDPENFHVNRIIFNLNVQPAYLPIFTEESQTKKTTYSAAPPYSLFWLGRLTDFKHLPVCGIINVLDHLNAKKGANFEFHIIGDGKDTEKVKLHTSKSHNVRVYFHGHLKEDLFNKMLLDEADIVISHGTSILEAAKLCIPSLVVNGSYFIPDVHALRVSWLHEGKDYFVGRLADSPEEFTGELLTEILEKVNAEYLQTNAYKSYQYWKANHSINKIGFAYLKMLDNCTFTYADYIESGVRSLGFSGSVMKYMKKRINERKARLQFKL